MRTLAVDAGNARVKWGLSENGRWHALGALPVDELARLSADEAWRGLPAPERIAVANVAGPDVRSGLARVLERWPVAPTWLRSEAAACGVTNGYAEPGQLGVDRWAGLVAARSRHRGDSLVVLAGTATTINYLDAAGTFRGGMIFPGTRLMKDALHGNTAELPLAQGEYAEWPRNTVDAIESGCRLAQAAAVGWAYRRLPQGAACFVSGGAAGEILQLLDFRAEAVEHLVLEGIVLLAQ